MLSTTQESANLLNASLKLGGDNLVDVHWHPVRWVVSEFCGSYFLMLGKEVTIEANMPVCERVGKTRARCVSTCLAN